MFELQSFYTIREEINLPALNCNAMLVNYAE